MLKKNMIKLKQVMCIPKHPSKVQPISKPENDDATFLSEGLTYEAWLMERPSALRSFESMMEKSKGKKIAVFLDYDGTLSPIVNDPDRAFMSDEMRSVVQEIGDYFPTAIISGRSREKVQEFVKLTNVYYAGSHGMDIKSPPRKQKHSDSKHLSSDVYYAGSHGMDIKSPPRKQKHSDSKHLSSDKEAGEEALFQPAMEYLPTMQKIRSLLVDKMKNIPGALVEDNMFCVSVHYRQVRDEDYDLLEKRVRSVLANYPKFTLGEGKKVLEIRPSIKWNKGHALEYLLEALGLDDDVIPLYIGDDKTDEDAFKVLRKRGKGYPIVVTSMPKDTKALYSLVDPSEVLTFLTYLVKWRKSSCSH